MNPSVEGYTAATFETVGAEGEAALADQLAAVARLVEGQAELRGALTDTAVGSRARRAVLSDLLEGRVSEPAQRLAAYAVSAVAAPDSLVALHWVAHRAAAGADRLELGLLGHRAARLRVGGYASAVFETSGTEQLEEVEDELFRFARIVESHPALRSDLTDRELPVSQRQAVVSDLLSGRVEAATLRLVLFVVAGGRPRDFVGALDWLVEQTATARGWRVARVRAAEPIDQSQRDALASAMSRLAGAPVELQVTLDPNLIGGAVVDIGDIEVDASARGRLERIREELLPATAGGRGRGEQ